MLAYAAQRRRIAQRHSAPHVMLAIIAAHIALIASVMSARMDVPDRIFDQPTVIDAIPLPEPPPEQPQPQPPSSSSQPAVDRVPPIIDLPRAPLDRLDPPVLLPQPVPGAIGPAINPQPSSGIPAPPVRVGPRFVTPPSAVRPPYPPSKIASGEEAVLKLSLSIDERGRVVAVEPVGRADRAFLAAARRHLIAKWRYRPATEDGRAIASSTVITLRFELDD